MRDNPTHAESFRLPGHEVLTISGRDAVAFAQAQCMNDVAALADAQWQWNGWLTPKGRVIALFALLRLDAETLWLILPDVSADALAAKLQRYVFRSKLKLEARGDLHACGSFGAPVQAMGTTLARDGDAVELDMSGSGGPRTLRISTEQVADDADALARWNAADLAHGLPRLPASQAEQWTPQQLSLERLRAFSVKKGCYPGQEIVARTHFLGQAKRGLALLQADAPLEPGNEVIAGGRAIGSIVCVQGNATLAVLPLERGDATLSCAGIALRELPLSGGLAR
ncbi:MAG: folate-binding protein [Thermomonas sp.]|uniref:CAF17-like 4Fe-4S cluster assembly/insertion protein YgfZ n=1 Tax=Thermomonas sp. TaxID=1971895 RepID=UPI0039E72255